MRRNPNRSSRRTTRIGLLPLGLLVGGDALFWLLHPMLIANVAHTGNKR